ncbi:DUF2075 domain-containing protein [Methylotenera versatilis]|uniref:Schlafen group 3-like DNA/RNA helicase domain-containing protein n=1 Tax=Methylotenera versatilis (strain 301) TaxID=666681 RepID=D7DNY8_METV0|nr:DUF2075 domain-containing protein [Methylotenera versatilis]ADI31019.1 Protein of unknown function DUF2075 [Methylotenera versatilis 301]
MSNRAYYSASVSSFLITSTDEIIGIITSQHSQDLVHLQTNAWQQQIEILKKSLLPIQKGHVFFEMLIPRMGRRADVVYVVDGVIFVLEFKIGESEFRSSDLRQTEGYAMDLSCFHETSHKHLICPILIATNAKNEVLDFNKQLNEVLPTIKSSANNLSKTLADVLDRYKSLNKIDPIYWIKGRYKPTPTIIEAAQALYAKHDVEDIARSDADAINLAETVGRINEIVHQSRIKKQKSICFVTGVPGAGKTLVGLNIATIHNNVQDEEHAVFLSGNGPLVDVLREALARDSEARNPNISITNARRETGSFIQNIHHFRDEYLRDSTRAPIEKVVIFDEAQRAWSLEKTSKFMQQKRNQSGFYQSEPEFLISVMDRHDQWCVVIALIGGGQEINDGEAGLNGWFLALEKNFTDWQIYYSEKLKQKEYAGENVAINLLKNTQSYSESSLHLATSMRSFRADKLSHFVHYLIHNLPAEALSIYQQISEHYPIFVTRDLSKAKDWVKKQKRGLESCGLIASAGAKRLKAEGIFVNNEIDATHWFLNSQDDVRSCHFLEDAGTEFLVQGLELDWCLIAWDADYRYKNNAFEHWSFKGSKWMHVHNESQQRYLENSYRVLLTRARQGMVIYLPKGCNQDLTRLTSFYDETYQYLKGCGISEI